MGRPIRENADYFSHDNGMRNDPKIKALRSKHGHAGYSVWNMTLELLTAAEKFRLELDPVDLEVVAGDFAMPTEEILAIWEYCDSIKLLDLETKGTTKTLFCHNLIRRMEPLMAKRTRKRVRNPVMDDQNPLKESKVKERKGKERKHGPPPRRPEEDLFGEDGEQQESTDLGECAAADGTSPPPPGDGEPGQDRPAEAKPAAKVFDWERLKIEGAVVTHAEGPPIWDAACERYGFDAILGAVRELRDAGQRPWLSRVIEHLAPEADPQAASLTGDALTLACGKALGRWITCEHAIEVYVPRQVLGIWLRRHGMVIIEKACRMAARDGWVFNESNMRNYLDGNKRLGIEGEQRLPQHLTDEEMNRLLDSINESLVGKSREEPEADEAKPAEQHQPIARPKARNEQ